MYTVDSDLIYRQLAVWSEMSFDLIDTVTQCVYSVTVCFGYGSNSKREELNYKAAKQSRGNRSAC